MAKKKSNKDVQPPRGVINLTHEYNRPDLTDWALTSLDEAIGGLKQLITRAAEEALVLALKDENTRIDWPAIWGDGDGRKKTEPVDPLTIYLSIALGDIDDRDPEYSFNLRAALEDDIAQCREDGSFSDGLSSIMNALRKLADDIESALPHESPSLSAS